MAERASCSTCSAERASSSSTCSAERASSSSTCSAECVYSSYFDPPPPSTCWFPSSMKGEVLQLSVRNVPYKGRVDFVDELKSLVKFKVSKPMHSRFFNGDPATLQKEGRRWLGELIAVDENDETGQPSLYTILQIRAATCWFSSTMKEQEVRLTVRKIASTMKEQEMGLTVPISSYRGRVDSVDELKSLLHLKLPKPRPPFCNRDLVTLQSKGGLPWLGQIILVDQHEDEEEEHTILRIRVPPAAEPLKSMENVLVTVKPVAKLESSQEGVKVGIKGFGEAERFLLVMGLQSIDIKVVAIHAPSMSTAKMAKVWKSPSISISVKDSETLIFTKRYYKGNRRKEDDVCVLLEHMEVTVFRDPNQIPWESANVDFILECSINTHKDDQSQVIGKTEASNNCLKCFPKVLDALGLYADGIMRARLHNANDDHEPARRAARFNIITRSSAAAKAVCHPQVFPDWNGDPTSMAFLATARLALQVTLVKAEDCSRVESSETKSCDADEGVRRRLIAIMSWCLDIIRCMPVGSCHLELA